MIYDPSMDKKPAPNKTIGQSGNFKVKGATMKSYFFTWTLLLAVASMGASKNLLPGGAGSGAEKNLKPGTSGGGCGLGGVGSDGVSGT